MKSYIIIIFINYLILLYFYGFINSLLFNICIFSYSYLSEFFCYDNNNGDHFFNKNKMRG